MENVWDITVGMEDVNAVWLEMCEHVGKENDKLVLVGSDVNSCVNCQGS